MCQVGWTLCAEHRINLFKADDKKLEEWVDAWKTDQEEKPHKMVGCSYVVVMEYDKNSQAIKENLKCKKWTNKKSGSL